jgi:hypothetical protein
MSSLRDLERDTIVRTALQAAGVGLEAFFTGCAAGRPGSGPSVWQPSISASGDDVLVTPGGAEILSRKDEEP